MHISDWKGRIATLVHDHSVALESIGCEDFPEEHPTIAIKHIFDRLKPQRLQTCIQHEFVVRESEKLKENDFYRFIGVLMKKAEVVSESIRTAPIDIGSGSVSGGIDKRKSDKSALAPSKRCKKLCPRGKRGNAHHKSSSIHPINDTSRGSKDDDKLPKCLNPRCNGRHLVKNCPNTSEELKKKLLTELYANVKESRFDRKNKLALNMMHGTSSHNSSLFTGIFCDNISVVVMADNGSDDNLMPPHVLRACPDTLVSELDSPIEFKMAVNSKPGQEEYIIVCNQSVRASVPLNIRHGTNIFLSNVTLVVPSNPCDTVLLGRPLLEALGLNVREILLAASDKHEGVVRVPRLMAAMQSDTLFHNLPDSSFFHSSGGSTSLMSPRKIVISTLERTQKRNALKL